MNQKPSLNHKTRCLHYHIMGTGSHNVIFWFIDLCPHSVINTRAHRVFLGCSAALNPTSGFDCVTQLNFTFTSFHGDQTKLCIGSLERRKYMCFCAPPHQKYLLLKNKVKTCSNTVLRAVWRQRNLIYFLPTCVDSGSLPVSHCSHQYICHVCAFVRKRQAKKGTQIREKYT